MQYRIWRRQRCKRISGVYAWVADLNPERFFDPITHTLLLSAVWERMLDVPAVKLKENEDLTTSKTNYDEPYLILGWQVTPTQEPRYWFQRTAKPGSQSKKDLVRIPADAIATHTVIIAQSGSGKSFFLGRLIEEILLQTKSRCLILDPNADFRKIHQIEDISLWKKAEYNPESRRGKLPHEASREEFEIRWVRVPIKIKTRANIDSPPYESLELRWQSLSMDLLAEELDPIHHSDLYHCHAFVQSLSILDEYKQRRESGKKSGDWIGDAERVLKFARQLSVDDFRSMLEREYDNRREDSKHLGLKRQEFTSAFQRLLTAPAYVSELVARFYFGKAREYQAAGILQKDMHPKKPTPPLEERLQVIDLPSLQDKRTRLLAINALLTAEWERARYAWSQALEKPSDDDTRVPTFIVVDEAHNLIPSKTHNKAEEALVEQFRTIVAEGRKYGLFLILVSQRPDKLDPLVVSECENKAVMKLGSASVLAVTRKMLGLEDVPKSMIDKCLEFGISRALLIGRWVSETPQIIYCAARRTVEGGRNLRTSHWAIPSESYQQEGKPETTKIIEPEKKGD